MRSSGLAAVLGTLVALSSGSVLAAGLPIGGDYATVAICIIDSITDAPMPVGQFDVAGAPLGRVGPDGAETAAESCTFERVLAHKGAKPPRSWSVEARCSGPQGDQRRVLSIAEDAKQGITVSNPDGSVFTKVDLCSLPYADRAARELKRMGGDETAR